MLGGSATSRRRAARAAVLLSPVLLATPLLAGTAMAKAKTSAPVITSKPASPTNATSATFAFTDSSAGATFACAMDGGASSSCSSPKTYTGLAAGSHQFSVRAQAGGKTQSNWVRTSWTIDLTPPALPTVTQPPTPTSSTAVSISFSDSDASTVGFTCSLDGTAASSCTSPFSASGLAEGSHSLAVTAVDAVGNGATRTVNWVVDHTAPSVPVVTPPSSPTNATSASIVFVDTASDVTGFTCSLDSATPVACTSPWAIAGPLAEGTHTVVVNAIDGAGNTTSGQADWVVDVTAPADPVIQSGPAAPTNQTGADFTVTENDPSGQVQCSVDGAAWAACASPVHEDVAEGSHVLSVRAVDGAGNSSAVATWPWTVDLTAPAPAAFTGGPGTPSNDTAPAFYFIATDSSANGFLCSLDGAAYASCDSGDAFPVSGDGPHTLSIENVDVASNISAPTTYTWELDTTAPAAPVLTSVPNSLSNAADSVISFTEPDANTTLTCAVDGGTPVACANSFDTGSLADGDHSVAVTASDLAGNTSVASYNWTVDTVAPATPAIDSSGLPTGPTSATTLSVPFSDSDSGVVFNCSLDGATPSACLSPDDLSGLSDGAHSLAVTASDGAGNVSTPATFSWTVDTTAPAVPVFVGGTPGTTSSTSVSIGFDDSEGSVSFVCSLDGATASACTSPYSASGLTEGSHSFDVSAVDAAGNLSSPLSTTFIVDTTAPPAPTFPASDKTLTNSSTYSLAFDEADPAATTTCALDGDAAAPCSSGSDFTGLSEGSHSVLVTATDAAGNASSASFGWVVDMTAPAVPDVTGVPAKSKSDSVTAHLSDASSDVTGFQCAFDGAAAAACSDPDSMSSLSDGDHTLVVTAVDAAGNESAQSTTNWTVDTTAPATPTFGSVPAAVTNATSASFSFSDADGSATFTCALDGAAASACTSPVSLSSLGAGAHTFVVTATDAADNSSSKSYSWTVDLTHPTATSQAATTITGATTVLFSEPALGISTSTVGLRVYGSSTNLALASLVCKSGSSTVSCVSPVTSALLTPKAALVPGQTYLPYVASSIHDPAGNSVVSSVTKFRAALSQEENSVAVVQAWKVVKASQAYGGSFISERRGNASVTYKFTATSVTWYTVTGTDQGYADVYIDGVKKAVVNNYASARHYHVARTWSGFTNALHTIKIVSEDKRGATTATNAYVSVDAVKVGATMYNTPSPVSVTWSRISATSASGKAIIRGDVNGAAVTMNFVGTSVRWYTVTGVDQGKAQVYIDGKLVSTIDNYGTSTKYGVARSWSKLSSATHTIRIVVLGQHRTGAKGSLVSIDRIVVG